MASVTTALSSSRTSLGQHGWFKLQTSRSDSKRSWDVDKTVRVGCVRPLLSSTRTHRLMEWKRDRLFRALARALSSGGTRQ
ncbi:hypothetical protein EVAR_5275_1 [Eumeta japonica]|uniref:Uncharacterized protein n=1 Tax=Eumeta variegata TaxID=151549 RepID=A0A4C1TNX6_EUMVA|nr:hypothetical protein EVAR_5275_1 [Eumeta japonica]